MKGHHCYDGIVLGHQYHYFIILHTHTHAAFRQRRHLKQTKIQVKSDILSQENNEQMVIPAKLLSNEKQGIKHLITFICTYM